MILSQVKSSYPAPRTLARLARRCRLLGITHQAVADAATKTSRRGSVGFTTVSRVLTGRTKSLNVVATIRRLIAQAESMRQERSA